MQKGDLDGDKRGIEGVARLYLSDAGRMAAGASRKQPPAAAGVPTDGTIRQEPVGSADPSPRIAPPSRTQIGGVVFADHLENAQDNLIAYVQQLARGGRPVFLLSVGGACVQATEFCAADARDSGSVSDNSSDSASSTHGLEAAELDALLSEVADDGHGPVDAPAGPGGVLAELLSAQADRHPVLAIDSAGICDDDLAALIESCGRVTVLATAGKQGIVAAYSKLKWLAPLAEHKAAVEVFLCECDNVADTEHIYPRMAAAAEQFLQLPLALGGFCKESDRAVLRRELLVSKCDQTVMGDIMNYLNQRKPKPAADELSQNDLASPAVESVDALPAWREGYLWPVTVEAFATTDRELIRCLEASIGCWLHWLPGAIILPMSLPAEFGADVRIFLDNSGRVHVFCATLFGDDALLRKVLAARDWFGDNIEAVAETFPQVKIDRSLGTEIILVAGGDARAIRRRIDDIADCPVLFLCLHRLRNELGSALLVTE